MVNISSSTKQWDILESYPKTFDSFLHHDPSHNQGLTPKMLEIFQVNLGKWCNQACHHCHVDASPIRTEMMDKETVDFCLDVIRKIDTIHTVDITGGAPEGNQHFRYLVEQLSDQSKNIIDRCNLTILETEGFEYLYKFLSSHTIELCCSLPFFSQSITDKQRGDGVFNKSITALKKLNDLGYGIDPNLKLNLVYNPSGLFVSSSQKQLEKEFKSKLLNDHGIVFNNLFCINNMPISRFLNALIRSNKFEFYMDALVNAFNPATIEGLMCRNQISVGYDGSIYDCDFNQMLDLKIKENSHIRNFDLDSFLSRKIITSSHCFGCTAGSGSSCGGEIA
ncbi:arsenosugar biosynthesis radical SAM (seleno)protein ArsS [Leptospira sp. GIMC2001]|uniref:arsenosugar biosynthesis radical SAM (seleno)protein ArsS n=1 Tax=Leptospira sp. GIMC2001 TaxID=1513297 RepID=UPI00234979F0|nr:arsenosugar biosynthesis radical SAM (seleno)protein ArsS [Leptospira sp. GIMC2001]WCL50288.1 arsenosugar biosynthesis radical SAM protein ArsS [Leptospira sp. GIMC2001]